MDHCVSQDNKSDTMKSAVFSGKLFRKLVSVIRSASGEISRNITVSTMSAILVPIIPDPHPISTTCCIFFSMMIFRARRIRHSVSSLGIRTSGVTTKSLPKK